MSSFLGTIGPLSVHPASPNLLTKYGPLGDKILATTSIKQVMSRAHLEFVSKLRIKAP